MTAEDQPAATGRRPETPSATRRRRWPKRVLFGGLGVVLLAVLYVGATFLQVRQASRHDGARPAEAIIVLGAAQYNGRASPVLRNRLDHALDLYQQKMAPVIVVTGGRRTGDRFTEAGVGYVYLRQHGVPDAAIRQEVQGRTTYESLASARRFLSKEGIDDVILVSGRAQSKRLAGIAHDIGLRAAISGAGGTPTRSELFRETLAVSAGRVVGYRRLEYVEH
jgi:vancomycin permeability regulator SanA